MSNHTYAEVAASYALWVEYVSPKQVSEARFNAMNIKDKVQFLRAAWDSDSTTDALDTRLYESVETSVRD